MQISVLADLVVSDCKANRIPWSKTNVNHDFLIATLQNCMLESIRSVDNKENRVRAVDTGSQGHDLQQNTGIVVARCEFPHHAACFCSRVVAFNNLANAR